MRRTTTLCLAAVLALSNGLLALSGAVAAAPPPGWSAPAQIEDVATYADGPSDLHVAVGQGGRALAAWTQYSADLGANVVLYSWYLPGQGWTPPVAITSFFGVNYPAVAAFPNGSFILVFRSASLFSESLLAMRWSESGGWTSTAGVSTDPYAADLSSPVVGTDGQGNAVVAFLAYDGTRWNVRANRYTPGSGWGAVNASLETSDFTASSLRLAVDHAGNAVAVWLQSDGSATSVYANRYVVGSGWAGTGTLLDSLGTTGQSPGVAVDSSGNAMAVWNQYNGTATAAFASRFVVGTGWGAAAQVSPSAVGSQYYDAVASAGGEFLVTWTQLSGSNQYVMAALWPASGAPGAAVNLTASPAGNAYDLVAAGNGAGDVLVAWRQRSAGADHVFTAWWSPTSGFGGVGQQVDASPNEALSPVAAVGGGGGAAVVWGQSDNIVGHLWGAAFWPPDTTAPSLSIAGPADGSGSENATVMVYGTAEQGAEVWVAGARVATTPVSSFAAWSAYVPLIPGDNLIGVRAVDAAGNEATASITVTYDDPVPGLEADLAASEAALAATQADVAATQAGLASAQASLAATQAQLASAQADLVTTRAALNTTQAGLTASEAASAAKDADLQGKVDAAAGAAGTAMVVGLLGLLVGAAGIAMGFMMSRKKPAALPASTPPAEPPKSG